MKGRYKGKTPADVLAYISDDYQPSVPAALAAWPRTGRMVRDAVALVPLRNLAAAKCLLTASSQLAAWSLARGLPMDAESVFSPDNVDDWVEDDGTRKMSRYRWDARAVGLAATRRAPWVSVPKGLPRTVKKFYSPADVARLRRHAAGQPSPGNRRVLEGVLALCLGAGLSSSEVRVAAGPHLRVVSGVPLIDVPGEAARTVPVDPNWAEEIARLARLHRDEPFVGKTRVGKNWFGAVKETLVKDDRAPDVNIKRLRSTYVLAEARRGRLPLADMLAAFGCSTVEVLRDVAPLLTPSSEAEVVARILDDALRQSGRRA